MEDPRRSCLKMRDEEVVNLQTVLGTFQSEVEEKERIQREAAVITNKLADAQHQVDELRSALYNSQVRLTSSRCGVGLVRI